MEDSYLTKKVVAKLVFDAQSIVSQDDLNQNMPLTGIGRALAKKTKAEKERERIRRLRNVFEAHSAKRRQSKTPTPKIDLEEGEILEEEETNSVANTSVHTQSRDPTPTRRPTPIPIAIVPELCPTFCLTGTTIIFFKSSSPRKRH